MSVAVELMIVAGLVASLIVLIKAKGAITCIMPVSIYTYWVRFKNTLVGMSRWLDVVLWR